MIKSIHLRNFQGHKATDLELSSGVNVISGTSDAGKSSIIRALWWLARNRPSGAGELFRYNKADPKKEEVSVSLELDDGTIKRFRKGTSNGYEVNGETLVAIRQDVPTEVSDLLDLDDHNIQTQHPPHSYFLVTSSAGDVARKLNEVCGLDIIDECLRNAALLATRNKQDVGGSKQRALELKESQEKYTDLDSREQSIQKLEKLNSERIGIASTVTQLDAVLAQSAQTQIKLEELNDFLGIEERANKLFEQAEKLEQLHTQIENLTARVGSVSSLKEKIGAANAQVGRAEEEFHQVLQDGKICPLCEQEVKHA